jgi:hypothetical protein
LPLTTKIHEGKRTTYIDDAVKLKNFVPAATRYNVTQNMGSESKKSGMPKGKRRLMTDEIATFQRLNPFPAPNAFKPDHTRIQKKLGGISYK